MNWESLEAEGGTAEEKLQARKLTALIETKFLTQFVTEPTGQPNILDLILRSNHGILHKYKLFETTMSDHKICEATVTINALINKAAQHGCKVQSGLVKLNFYHKKKTGLKLRTN